MPATKGQIWTIGHSTHRLDDFIALLIHYDIECIADVRRFPGSRRYPHFNCEPLAAALKESGIAYVPFPGLGGRRGAVTGAGETGWRNRSFANYAGYMATEAFQAAITKLEVLAGTQHVALMCAEAVWWRCHRRLIADYLTVAHWQVFHILSMTQMDRHRLLPPARLAAGRLTYAIK